MAYLVGNNWANLLEGTSDNDTIIAKGGNDTILCGGGDDYINGGRGQDTVDYTTYHGRLSVILAEAGETKVYADGRWSDTLVSIENVTGGSGDDYFVGNSANNTFRGGEGHDYFVASLGYDSYYGDSGYDMIDYSGVGTALTIRPTDQGYSTVIAGGTAYDTLYSVENIIGTRFNDIIEGDTSDNFLRGMKGKDTLSGGDGGDVLDGGAGNDQLTGGADADIFQFKGRFGNDIVTDFNAHGDSHDFIDLSGVKSLDSFEDLIARSAVQSGNDVIIDAGKSGTITLRNVDLDHLSTDQFIF